MPRPGRRSRGDGGRGGGRGTGYPFNPEIRRLLETLGHKGARGDWEDFVDRAQDLLERDFAPLTQYILEADLSDMWKYIVSEPPWTPSSLLTIIKKNEGSFTDQGFPSMIQVQAACLFQELRSISDGQNPGPARALRIVNLVHDMFFGAPRSFVSTTQGYAPSISDQEAGKIRARGMACAKDLLQECVEQIKNSVPGDSETESAWDNNSTGFYNGGPNREVNHGCDRGYDRGYDRGEERSYNRGYGGQREAPSTQMTSDGASTYSNPINSWKPVLKITGRGPPPGMGVGVKRMDPPQPKSSQVNGVPHPQTQEMGGYFPHASGMGFPANNTSQPQGQLPNQFVGGPQFNSFPGLGQGFPSAPGENLHSSAPGMGGFPGQPALGSVHSQIYTNQGTLRPQSVQNTGPSGTLTPPQPPGPMPPLRGSRPPPVRGPGFVPPNTRPSSNHQIFDWSRGPRGGESIIPPGYGPPGQPYANYPKMPNGANLGYSAYDLTEVSMEESGQNGPFQHFSDNAPEGGSFRQDQI